MTEPYLIGVTGGSASGKTYFLNKLLQEFEERDICLISQDNYYYSRDQQPLDENGVKNFDTPESIDSQAFLSDIQLIKNGRDFEKLEYTFNNPNKIPQLLQFKASPIVIVEGLFVMYFEKVKALLDLKVFIETKPHIKLKRRIVRDKMERGYDLDDVLYRFEKHVMPTFDRYLKPLRQEADIIIPNNEGFDRALEVLVGYLKSRLSY